MVIIGIAGGIGYGKTTLAEYLLEIEPNAVYLEMSALIADVINDWQSNTSDFPKPYDIDGINKFIGKLTNVLRKKLHVSIGDDRFAFDEAEMRRNPELYEKLFVYLKQVAQNPALSGSKITPENKSDYRAILQWTGGYVQYKLPPGTWFKELIRKAAKLESTGTKLCVLSGVRFPADIDVIHESGGFVVMLQRKLVREIDTTDLTEKNRNKLNADINLHNNAGLSDLKMCAKKMYDDILSGKPKKDYAATDFQVQ